MQQTQPSHTIGINGWSWHVPITIDQCCLCKNDVGQITICKPGHTICSDCFDTSYDQLLGVCPLCNKKNLYSRKTSNTTRGTHSRALNCTLFHCAVNACNLPVEYHDIEKHQKECPLTEVDCDYGCGSTIIRKNMITHQKKCRKRPWCEGQLDADYETIQEIKKLKRSCEVTGKKQKPLTQAKKVELFDRMAACFPLVTEAALSPAEHSVHSAGNTPCQCQYQCGYIAERQTKLGNHFIDCPNRPIQCRHCSTYIEQKNIVKHEIECDARLGNERLNTCTFCSTSLPWGQWSSHINECTCYPVKCTLCKNYVSRKKMQKHTESRCPARAIECRYCFEYTTPGESGGHSSVCRFLKPIVLGAETDCPVRLLSQQGAIGPFYQEEGGDSSTVYLAVNQQNLQSADNPYRFWLKFYLAGNLVQMHEETTGSGTERVWKISLMFDSTQECCQFDFLDADNNHIVAMHDISGYERIIRPSIVSSDLGSTYTEISAALQEEERLKLINYEHPDDLRLLRMKVCHLQKPFSSD